MTLGESIYSYRKRAGLSQEALAERVGVSRQAVSRWELDDATPEVNKLKLLAEAFHITVDQLLSGEEPAEPYQTPNPILLEGDYQQEPPSGWDRLPGFLGRMVRRWGWLAGVYLALEGLGVALVGGLARFAFGRMFRIAVGDMFGMGGDWATAVVDGMGNPVDLPPGVIGEITGGFGQVSVVSDMGQVFLTIASVIIAVGLLTTLTGILLALWLHTKGREK